MREEFKYVLGTLLAIAVIGGGLWLARNWRKQTLPTGTMTQITPTATPTPGDQQLAARPQVEFTTTKGKFTLELRPDVSPNSVANFLAKWSSGYCNNLTFHRVEDWVVQGCDPAGDGTGGQTNLPTENSIENFGLGAVGVARKQFPTDVSNDSQFFITKKESSFLNGQYTYLGRVISGMETVNSLAKGDKILDTTVLTK